jgi:hypothetical protein
MGMNALRNGNNVAAMARFREVEDVLANQGNSNGPNGEMNNGSNANWSNRDTGWSGGYSNRNSSTWQLRDQVRNEIDQARDAGCNVSAADSVALALVVLCRQPSSKPAPR